MEKTITEPKRNSDRDARSLALGIAEMDESFARSRAAWQKNLEIGDQLRTDFSAGLQRAIEATGWLERFFSRKLIHRLQAQIDSRGEDAMNQSQRRFLQGVELIEERLRRLMLELQIERLDVQGKPFDSDMMHAIEATVSNAVPPGHVIEQLRPAYLYRSQVLRYAEVRVAQ